jgi:hypothetical protein
MNNTILFTRLLSFVTLCLFASLSKSQTLGPSTTEVRFSYSTTFEIPIGADEDDNETRANFHASHLFGIFHSPTLVKKYIGPKAVIGGIGAPRTQMKIRILSASEKNGKVVIRYSNSGKMLLHKKAADKILKNGGLVLPLPNNPYEIYDEKCTDEIYNSFGDFWYFYDPYRPGCTHLSQEPMAVPVKIKMTELEYKKIERTAKLPWLRGNNGNGDLFQFYIINGYEDDGSKRNDPGRINFKELEIDLIRRGFTISKKRPNTKIPMNIYSKMIQLDNGKTIEVEINHLLVDTGIGTKSAVFAKFLKEAVAEADVIIYGGHSGLGANLDIPSLEEKAGGPFKFNSNKRQLFYFDSCASYSYYLEHFAVEKTKAKIDIISNGLSSYFHTSQSVLSKLLDRLFSEKTEDVEWLTILNEMESPLEGDSYLLNVGGI